MAESYRILVTGSRNCTEDQAVFVAAKIQDEVVRDRLKNGARPVVVVHGKCPYGGVDLAAHKWAEIGDGMEPEPHPADWGAHGRAAGPIRNGEMVATRPDVCLAFPAKGSRGTWDCVRQAADAGIPIQVWPLPVDDSTIDALIEASSLGSPGAKRLRQRTLPDVARRIVQRSHEIAAQEALRATETRQDVPAAPTGHEPASGDLSGPN